MPNLNAQKKELKAGRLYGNWIDFIVYIEIFQRFKGSAPLSHKCILIMTYFQMTKYINLYDVLSNICPTYWKHTEYSDDKQQ